MQLYPPMHKYYIATLHYIKDLNIGLEFFFFGWGVGGGGGGLKLK